MASTRILIADDHAILRSGLRMLIDAQSDMCVVGEVADGTETVSRALAVKADIVLLDLTMPGPPATVTIERLARLHPGPRVLVLTMHDDPVYLRAALQAGAAGYVVKKAADIELLNAIRVVQGGGTFVNLSRPGEPEARQGVRQVPHAAPAAGQLKPLSQREVEVLRLLAQGHTNQEAAERLAVSVKTIETHRKRLSVKLGFKSRAELFRFAVEARLL